MKVWVIFNNILKRIFDIIASLLAIVIFSPVLIFCAIWVKRDTNGPIFFKQGRRTKNGKVFNMLKFRSMIVNAEKMGTGLFNYENDPRVTKSGKFLRDHSLDELPQLFNILVGDMSVIGPRPCVNYELGDYETLNKRYKKRFMVKAGLSGLAQIQGRNELLWDDKVRYDNKYIDLYSKYGLVYDFYIILMTVINVFKHEDIYEEKIDNSVDDVKAAEMANEEVIRKAHELED